MSSWPTGITTLLILGLVAVLLILVIALLMRRRWRGSGGSLQERLSEYAGRDQPITLEEIELSQPFAERVLRPILRRLRAMAGATQTTSPPLTLEQERVLDAAIPQRVPVHKATELVVLIRRKESEGLPSILERDRTHLPTQDDVRSSAFHMEFPSGPQGQPKPTPLRLRVNAPDFEPPVQERTLVIHADPQFMLGGPPGPSLA